jgi:hypothetical protein
MEFPVVSTIRNVRFKGKRGADAKSTGLKTRHYRARAVVSSLDASAWKPMFR